MICLSSAGSLAPFDGESSTRASVCSFGGPKDRLWKCDAQALPYKANGAPRPPATVAAKKPLARRRDPRSSVCRHTSDRRKGSRGAPRTPRLQPVPRLARESKPRQRPTPVRTLPLRGEGRTEVGWELHSKEHTSRRNLEMPYAFKVSMIH